MDVECTPNSGGGGEPQPWHFNISLGPWNQAYTSTPKSHKTTPNLHDSITGITTECKCLQGWTHVPIHGMIYQGAKTLCIHPIPIWVWNALQGGIEPQPWPWWHISSQKAKLDLQKYIVTNSSTYLIYCNVYITLVSTRSPTLHPTFFNILKYVQSPMIL